VWRFFWLPPAVARPWLASVTMQRLIVLVKIAACAGWCAGADISLDGALPSYQPAREARGSLISTGSDTLNNLMTFWTECFREWHPQVTVQVEGKGSGTAPPALIAGTAQLGPMSRGMKVDEIDAFQRKFGYPPTEIRVAVDALAVFAHKDNPLESLTLPQLDAIFSPTRRLGHAEDIREWGQLGVMAWRGRRISLFGRNSASGTYGFFQEKALGKGDFRASVKEQPGSSAVIQGVASDPFALGYSAIGYLTSGVKALAVAREGGAPVGPTYQNCLDGSYPMARFLVIYVNKHPDRPLDATTGEFLRMLLSREGQELVLKDHYYPLPGALAREILRGIEGGGGS
jgi:phosphate transport system substrate-binding protein